MRIEDHIKILRFAVAVILQIVYRIQRILCLFRSIPCKEIKAQSASFALLLKSASLALQVSPYHQPLYCIEMGFHSRSSC